MGTIVMLPCCSQVHTPQSHSLSLEKHSPFPRILAANKLKSCSPWYACCLPASAHNARWLPGTCADVGASDITDDLTTVGSRVFHQVWTHGIDRPVGTNWIFNPNCPPVCTWWGALQVCMCECVWKGHNYLNDGCLLDYLTIFWSALDLQPHGDKILSWFFNVNNLIF